MAKSRQGGTRSMIRGRVGADVYAIGKDSKGKKQQVVRSLAETVANPQTVNQMRGRMIMSTIMQAVSELRPIIDHSFDNVVGAQPNISEFIRVNYKKVKADVAAHPSSNNVFGLVKYQEKGAKQGAYQISDGKAAEPAAMVITKASGILTITLPADAVTMDGLKSALSFGAQDYVTLVGINAAGAAEYVRLHINQSISGETAISASNIADVFELDGNITPSIAIASNVITITDSNIAGCCAFIVTRNVNGSFIHSKATLGDAVNSPFNADAALPTYPVGEQKFLNGGDQSFSPALSPEPEPEPTPGTAHPLTISAASGITSVDVQAGGATIQSGASVNAGVSLSVSGVVAESGYHMEASLNGNTISLTKNGTTYSGTASMPNANATLTLTKVADSQEPVVEGRSLKVNNIAKTIGGDMVTPGGAAVSIELTLPAGDPLIGYPMGIESGGTIVSVVETLQAGVNSGTLPSQYTTGGSAKTIYAGENDGEMFNEGCTKIQRISFAEEGE